MSCPLCRDSEIPRFLPHAGGWVRCDCDTPPLGGVHANLSPETTKRLFSTIRCEEYRKLLKTIDLHLKLFGESGLEPERTMRLLAIELQLSLETGEEQS